MPTGMRRPNLGNQLKSNNKLMNVPRAGAQKAAMHGDIASNNKLVSMSGGGSRKRNSSGPKRGKRMY